jgi:hypothetical protein
MLSPHFKELFHNLDVVLSRIARAGLTLNSRKCCLLATKISILGHVVSKQGVQPNSDKIDVVKSWPTPFNKKQLRYFLGLATYYRRFILSFAKIAASLHHLTSILVPWKWTEVEDTVFLNFKSALIKATVFLGNPL